MTDLPHLHGLSLRSVGAGDLAFVAALYASTRDDLRQSGADPAMLATLIGMQQQLHEHGQRSAWPHARHSLVERAGEPIGRMVVDVDAERGMRLVDIALLPQCRGLGHGSALLRALQARSASLGVPLRLRVAASNGAAKRLYAALGFTVETAGDASDEMVWRAGSAA